MDVVRLKIKYNSKKKNYLDKEYWSINNVAYRTYSIFQSHIGVIDNDMAIRETMNSPPTNGTVYIYIYK